MIVCWQVDDGSAGPGRSQKTEVDDQELAECKTDEEREQLISDYIQEDFNNNINWYRV